MVKSIIKKGGKLATGASSRRMNKVSFGPYVLVKEIPFYAEEDIHLMFYTDEEYDEFEAAEQRRLATIRLLYQEYKRQHRLMTLQFLLDSERRSMMSLNDLSSKDNDSAAAPVNINPINKRTACDQPEQQYQVENQNPIMVSSAQEQMKPNPAMNVHDANFENNPLNRLAKRRRLSMVKLSAFAA